MNIDKKRKEKDIMKTTVFNNITSSQICSRQSRQSSWSICDELNTV